MENHDWQVDDLAKYSTWQVDDDESQDLGMSASLLIPLDNSHRNNGAFRLALYGGDLDTVKISSTDLFHDIPESLQDLSINIPCKTSEIVLPENCTAGPWMDTITLIRNVSLCANYPPSGSQIK
jgi:hypothetical protein